jgi:hypothetical protein
VGAKFRQSPRGQRSGKRAVGTGPAGVGLDSAGKSSKSAFVRMAGWDEACRIVGQFPGETQASTVSLGPTAFSGCPTDSKTP